MDGEALPGNGAAQQAAAVYGGDAGQALSLLEAMYAGEGRSFGYDSEKGRFWTMEGGKISSILTAPTPEELVRLIDGAPGRTL